MLTVLDVCSGIGGFSLGLERTEQFRTVAFCEIDPYCQQVIRKHWPDIPILDDIHHVNTTTLRTHDIEQIDVLTAGFPCQPTSQIGKRLAQDDERWIWPQIARLVRELRPRFVLLENTPGLLNANNGSAFGDVLRDLARGGYDAEWQVLSSAAFGAHHIRSRVWIVAYPNGLGYETPQVFNSKLPSPRRVPSQAGTQGDIEYRRGNGDTLWPTPNDRVCGVVDEISERLDGYHALGNAVDPVITEWIGRQLIAALKGE
jgi:DNA (cytosine-5)-methyltransferase 1